MNSKIWGHIKDALVLAVIPLVLWGVRLEITLAVQQEKLNTVLAEVSEASTTDKDISRLVQTNANQLTALNGKIDVANARLDAIKDLLDR
jgi:hypothetical protein